MDTHACRPNKVDCPVCSPELHVDCGCADKAPKWSQVAQTKVAR